MLGPKDVFDICLTCWDRTAQYRTYIRSFGDNLTALEGKMGELDGVYDGMNRLVSTAEAKRWIRTEDVAGWLGRVEVLKKQVHRILEEGNELIGRSCLCGICFKNCRTRYLQSKLAEDTKTTVQSELDQGRIIYDSGKVAYQPGDVILGRSLEDLRSKSKELHGFFKDVEQRVASKEAQHLVRTHEVRGWLERVADLLEKHVPAVLEQADRLEMEMKSCQRNRGETQPQSRDCPSYHELSKHAEEKRAILEEELEKGRGFTIITYKPDDPLMAEIPLEPPVGIDSSLEEVWDWVGDENVRSIALFGMPGVGKTTLLDKIHNKFLQVNHDYNLFIRVVVSRPANLESIQDTIWKKLMLPKEEWERSSKEGRVSKILSLMKQKNFVLFLDDLWDSIDLLTDLGIPSHDHPNKCKIIFTTRVEEVCNAMQPDMRMKIECLPHDKALELFRQKVGEKTWNAHSGIPEIAETIVKECKCLPLALVTVARAMSSVMELKGWIDAEKDLKSQASKFPGMSEKVLARLQFSYDRLPSDCHKRCFVYLPIFPEDHEICVDDVIDLWIGEGLVDGNGGFHEARSYGEKIFKTLEHACLVEFVKVSFKRGKLVKMHDVIREMALWVASEHGNKRNKVLVREELKPSRSGEFKKWKDAEIISLWRAKSLPDFFPRISCSYLSTLMLKDTRLVRIPSEVFPSMPSLKVVDISDNQYLRELPESIGQLIHLQYLNLSNTNIEDLPMGTNCLIKLVVLILPLRCQCSPEVISNLPCLRVFSWFDGANYNEEDIGPEMLEVLLAQGVEDISLGLRSAQGVEKLLSCPELLSSLRSLFAEQCEGLTSFRVSATSLRSMEHLQFLWLDMLDDLSQLDIGGQGWGPGHAPRPSRIRYNCFPSLSTVFIHRTKGLRDLTSLINHAPFLEMLEISECDSLREIISSDTEEGCMTRAYLSCLTQLRLYCLPQLSNICRTALPLDSLQVIRVVDCPKLEKLPLACDSAKKSLRKIQGQGWWWRDLKWEDSAAQQVFSSKFVEKSRSCLLYIGRKRFRQADVTSDDAIQTGRCDKR